DRQPAEQLCPRTRLPLPPWPCGVVLERASLLPGARGNRVVRRPPRDAPLLRALSRRGSLAGGRVPGLFPRAVRSELRRGCVGHPAARIWPGRNGRRRVSVHVRSSARRTTHPRSTVPAVPGPARRRVCVGVPPLAEDVASDRGGSLLCGAVLP